MESDGIRERILRLRTKVDSDLTKRVYSCTQNLT